MVMALLVICLQDIECALIDFTLKVENLKQVAKLVGKQVPYCVPLLLYSDAQGMCDNCAPNAPSNRKEVRSISLFYPIVVLCQMEGVGPDGRMFMFKTPNLADQNSTLWNMFYSMKNEKEALRKKLDYEVNQTILVFYNVSNLGRGP